MTQLSVTEVRNALRCPRVFALGRQTGRMVSFPVGSSAMGSAFHRIAERLFSSADNPPRSVQALPTDSRVEQIAQALADWLLRELVLEIEATPHFCAMPTDVDELAEALRHFASYLASRIAEAKARPADALQSFLHAAEVSVEQAVPVEGGAVSLRGRVDAIFAPDSARFEVVEYKLTDEANASIDEAQVALYRQLLRWDRDLEAEPVVLRFTPELTAVRVPALQADQLAETRLFPLIAQMARWATQPQEAPATERTDICPTCPVRRECADTYRGALPPRDQPPSGALRPRPTPEGDIRQDPIPPASHDAPEEPDEGVEQARELTEAIVTLLRECGVSAVCRDPVIGARLIALETSVRRGSITKLDRSAQDVCHQLHFRNDVECWFDKRGSVRRFLAKRRKPRPVELGPLLRAKEDWLTQGSGRFVLGEAMDGTAITGDLGDHSCCHMLVAGSTGSGKSVLLRGIVASLVQYHGPEQLSFTLIDPKRLAFTRFAQTISSFLTGPVHYDVEEVLPVLEDLVVEMHDRYEKFANVGADNLDEYNELVERAERLPRRIVVADEFEDLVVSSKELSKAFLTIVQRLGSKARAAGIHLVLATQRPAREVVPGQIKANLTGRVALRVPDGTASRIILDRTGAEELLGRGDFIANLTGTAIRGQAPLVE